MNVTQVKGERTWDTLLMLIRRTYLHRKHLLLPAALRPSSRLINEGLINSPVGLYRYQGGGNEDIWDALSTWKTVE